MDDRAGRWLGGLAALIGLWIVVYWLWEPGGTDLDAPGVPNPALLGPSEATDTSTARSSGDGDVFGPGSVEPAEILDAAGLQIEPPRFREYTVREGETMQTIARREYGSVSRWTVIARANPLLDPNRLRPGRVIRLPVDPGNVQGRVVGTGGSDGAEGDADGAARGRDDSPVEVPSVIEYRVVRGDTLGEIARRFYGSARWTDFLFQANRDRLRSPGSIRLGQTLLIPPKPAGATGSDGESGDGNDGGGP
ncbi:MAG: LysM peptidoglycan-binding domain-containing protein [Planctomycetota bacterium]